MPALATSNISFEAFSAIGKVIEANVGLKSDALRAVLVFGDLVATGESHDINLVEVVREWQGPRRVAFKSTDEMPLRGRMTVYFLLPHEFENWTTDLLPGEDFSAAHLLARVEPAYDILLQRPAGYVFDVMQRGGTQAVGPFTYFSQMAAV